jgi:predicted nicotinamide N-methyase
LSFHLFQNHDFFKFKTVLEIGSGVGLVAVIASLCGVNKMFATDLDRVWIL